MEERKAIVEKMVFKVGAMDGKHMVSEVKKMKIKLDKIENAYVSKNFEEFKKVLAKMDDKRKELLYTLLSEIVPYAPKRIHNYFNKVINQAIDNAIDIFNIHLKELTLKYNNGFMPSNEGFIPSSEYEGLLEMYNKLLDEAYEKITNNGPKGINTYFNRLLLQQKSILKDYAYEEREKIKAISAKKYDKDLGPISIALIDKLHDTFDSITFKRFDKIRTEIEKDKYNLKKSMSEEEFTRFLFVCLSTFYYKGIFTEYNKDSLKDIYCFHLSSAPYFNDKGTLEKGIEATEEMLTSHFKDKKLHMDTINYITTNSSG